MMNNFHTRHGLWSCIFVSLILFMFSSSIQAETTIMTLKTRYAVFQITSLGRIASLHDATGHEYVPTGHESPLMQLFKQGTYMAPVAATADKVDGTISLSYADGCKAQLRLEEKGDYLRVQLISLYPRNGVNDIVWGPYATTLSKYIGDIFSVVHDDNFAIGIMALDDNTTSGPPVDGEMTQASYIIHSPDPVRYPLPSGLVEGQRFRIGGDGISDVAFFSHPEEYYRYIMGNGAQLEPAFGSSIVLHARDRRTRDTIFYPRFNDFPAVKAPRHVILDSVNVDYMQSAIAFYACPDRAALKVIEQVVKNEGLPYITRNGKWVKDPTSFCADMAWYGPQDSLVSYARQLGLRAVQDEGLGEYYVNPADRWGGKSISLGGKKIPLSQWGQIVTDASIDYGLHTLTEFVQPHSSDVQPLTNPKLCTVLRTVLTQNVSLTDTAIYVADTLFLNERGGWDENHVNAIRIDNELISYQSVSTSKPYRLIGVKRGAWHTQPTSHLAGTEAAKLQVNCYAGFVPDLDLQDQYADFYAKLLIDGGMNYIDFDGFESFTYQGQGQYSFKRFLRRLFNQYSRLGGKYLRVMGSCVFEGNWHYMSVCSVGGGNNMFNPRNNEWGIEGKDIRYAYNSSYFPCTFGIQNLSSSWDVQTIENLQSKAIAWDATYMLGLSEHSVEQRKDKQPLFRAFRLWEEARAAQAFPDNLKKEMREKENRYHLESAGKKGWKLYKVLPDDTKVYYKLLKPSKSL